MTQFNGLVAATVTPMHSDGTINLSVIPKYIDHLLRTGVKAVFVNGSTGEWSSLSTEERKTLTEAWIKHGKGKLENIIVHCGALSIVDTKDLVKHAADHGADAISCISPTFFKPQNEEYLVDYLAEVASVGSTIPFLYYHIPLLTNVEINMSKFLLLANHKIPTFSGLKISTQDFQDVYLCLEFTGKELAIYYGIDNQLLAAMVMGVKGAIGSFYNFLGTQYNSIMQDFQNGNLKSARGKQIKVSLDILTLYKMHGNGMTKVLTTLVSGIETGPSRLPMKNDFSDMEITEIARSLEGKGYF